MELGATIAVLAAAQRRKASEEDWEKPVSIAVEQAVAADGGAAGKSCRIEKPSRRHRRR